MLEIKLDTKNDDNLIQTQVSRYKIRKVDRNSSKNAINSQKL